jgi:hypothetical protein
MAVTTIGVSSAKSQMPAKPVETEQFKSAVNALAVEFISKKPEAGKFETRKDLYRAIMINVVAVLAGQNEYAERKSRVADAGMKGVEACTDMDKVCADYEIKALKAAGMLLSDKELASEAMAEYMTQRMSRTDMQELTIDKKREYREVKEEIRNQTDVVRFRYSLPIKQVDGRPPAVSAGIRR